RETGRSTLYTHALHDARPLFVLRHAVHDELTAAHGEGVAGHADEALDEVDRLVVAAEHDDVPPVRRRVAGQRHVGTRYRGSVGRSAEHTSELQSRENLVLRLL